MLIPTLLIKDLKREIRRKTEVVALLSFVLAFSIPTAYALSGPNAVVERHASLMLTSLSLTLLYAFLAVIIGFLSILKEGDALLSLKLSPIEPTEFFIAKVLFGIIMIYFLSIVYMFFLSFFSAAFMFTTALLITLLFSSIYIASLSALVSLMIIYTDAGVLLSATLMLALGVPFLQQLPSSIYESFMNVVGTTVPFVSLSFLTISTILSRYLIEV